MRKTGRIAALVIGGVFTLFGLVSIASVGWWFLIVGSALISSVAINDPRIRAAVLAGATAFVATVALTGPFVCTSTQVSGQPGTTECSNPLGIDYSGGFNYDAPMWPALLAGVAAGSESASAAALVVSKWPGSSKQHQVS